MYKDNLNYARQRLTSTVVRVGEEPYFVADVFAGGKVMGWYLENNGFPVEVDLDDLNLEPVPLGYVNYKGSSYYLVRKPMRNDWRQGLRPANIAFVGDQGFNRFPDKELRNTILNIYPSFKEAAEKIGNLRQHRVAFSRNFAVSKGNFLEYKGRVVGSYDKLVDLYEQFKYLNEHLQETLHGYA